MRALGYKSVVTPLSHNKGKFFPMDNGKTLEIALAPPEVPKSTVCVAAIYRTHQGLLEGQCPLCRG